MQSRFLLLLTSISVLITSQNAQQTGYDISSHSEDDTHQLSQHSGVWDTGGSQFGTSPGQPRGPVSNLKKTVNCIDHGAQWEELGSIFNTKTKKSAKELKLFVFFILIPFEIPVSYMILCIVSVVLFCYCCLLSPKIELVFPLPPPSPPLYVSPPLFLSHQFLLEANIWASAKKDWKVKLNGQVALNSGRQRSKYMIWI